MNVKGYGGMNKIYRKYLNFNHRFTSKVGFLEISLGSIRDLIDDLKKEI